MVNEQVARLSHNEAVTNDLKRQVDELKNRLSQKFAPISHIGGTYVLCNTNKSVLDYYNWIQLLTFKLLSE